nr:reverse transcriptase domain-containing protein [Tanacetum cinerariifolium]
MRTRRSYFPPTPRRSRKQTTNVVEPEFRTIVEMVDNCTMAQMLQAPIEGYEDAIVVPQINANNFELKQMLINLVQSNQFTGRQDPHNHLRFFNKVTSTFRHPEVPNTTIKLLLFPFSLEGEARIWLEKEPPRSILTWEDLVSKFINQFFPPSKTTQCPHHWFSELHQLDTFYNALNPNDQDALDYAAGGNFLDKIPRECLSIIESKSKVRYSKSRVTDVRANTNAPLSSSSPSNFFDLQSGITYKEPPIPPSGVEEQEPTEETTDTELPSTEDIQPPEDPIPPHLIIPNQTKLSIEEPKHSFKMGHDHFNTNLVTKYVAESSTKNLIPIPHECKVVSENESQSTEPVNDNSSIFTTISNPLFDNDKINSDEINSHVKSNSDESTSNHDTVKCDYLDEFYGPFIPIHILEEERIRKEHADYINRMEIVENDDSKEEVDAVGDLRVDNFIQNSEHEYSESEDFDFDNPLLPLPPPEPPDKEFDFQINFESEISVVRNVIVKFECIDAKVKFDVFNDENNVLSYFMFVIFAKEFSLLSAESEDTIFDPGISN